MSSSRNVIAPANQPLQLPFQVGNTLQRPDSPPNGFMRVNSQTNYVEVYYNNNWISIMAIGSFATVTISDPYFMYNILLLTGNGINNSQNNTFIDSSPNNFTLTRVGNSTQGSFSPYPVNWSNYFNVGIYIAGAGVNAPTAVQSNNFTIELWIYLVFATDTGNIQTFYSNYTIFTNAGSLFFGKHTNQTGRVAVYISNYSTTVPLLTEPDLPPGNQWVHYALVRNNNTLSIYRNGIITVSASYTGAVTGATNSTIIGTDGQFASTLNMRGYISNFRIVNGTALYVGSNFAVPTAPLTAVGGTVLLTCQSNRVVDNSISNLTLNPTGALTVQPFSPFLLTGPYSVQTIGGSGYFDGTGDYLTAPSSAAFTLGTGDFTVEAWVYATASFAGAPGNAIAGNYIAGASGSDAYWTFGISATSNVYITGRFTTLITSTGIIRLRSWNHVAITRQSGTSRAFINGVLSGTSATVVDFSATSIMYVGAVAPTAGFTNWNGYISDFRVVKGTAVYTESFNLPTAPIQSISGTSLLTNFTNGGIIDNAMMLNSETQTNAKISTAQAKFGQSSMFFDGTSALSIPYNLLLNFGLGNFTIEFWTYVTATPSTEQYFVSVGPAGGGSVFRGWRMAAHNGTRAGIYFMASNIAGSVDTLLGDFPSANVWHHIAIVRNGTTIKGYVDGIPLTTTINASTTTITDIVAGDYSFVGAIQGTAPTGRLFYNGYIQDLRITNGYARYIFPFTPPTQALPTY